MDWLFLFLLSLLWVSFGSWAGDRQDWGGPGYYGYTIASHTELGREKGLEHGWMGWDLEGGYGGSNKGIVKHLSERQQVSFDSTRDRPLLSSLFVSLLRLSSPSCNSSLLVLIVCLPPPALASSQLLIPFLARIEVHRRRLLAPLLAQHIPPFLEDAPESLKAFVSSVEFA